MNDGFMAKAKKAGKTRLIKCAFCNGTGVDPNSGTFSSSKRCPTCKGKGKVWM